MLKISALEWTDLNPKATPFIPRNFNNNDIKQNNESVDFTKSLTNSSANGLSPKPTSSSTSKSSDKSKTKKKSKPTTVTLEQFISEKLKIDDEIKPKKVTINSTHNLKHKNKTQTHEMPNNLLDSSAPTRKRGKERENPKSKKPTTLKKIIIQEKSSSLEKSNNETIENDSQIENSDINDSKVVVNYDLNEINKQILHNKTYREYCNQQLSQEIDNFVVNLLSDLVVFQDRLYLRDPLKAKIRKRLSFGFREVTKYAIINKVKMLIIAPDIEKIETKGGLDDTLTQLLRVIRNNQTPVVFALTRRNLGITCKKKGFVSCVGVLNYDGSQDNFKQLITLCESARMEYNSVLDESYIKLKSLNVEEITDILSKLPNIPNQFFDFRRRLNPNDRRLIRRKTKSINSLN